MGVAGPPGSKGDKGGVGQMGAKGEHGERGEPGQTGIRGEKGDHGVPGLPGTQGLKGEIGPPGNAGISGPMGLPTQCSLCLNENDVKPENVSIRSTGERNTPPLVLSGTDCVSFAIGHEESFGLTDGIDATFMTDSNPSKEAGTARFWATTNDNMRLLEFHDAPTLFFNRPSRIYDLEVPFHGNAHVIYNGFFFYKLNGQIPKIIRYDLKNKSTRSLLIPGFEKCKMKPLYLSSYNYVDLSVDQNGLWAIFSNVESDSTTVIKINHNDMNILNTWEIAINNKHVIDMFMAYGVLYTVEFSPTFDIEIHLAVNLISNNVTLSNIQGIHQTGGITTITYDYRNEELLVIDGRKRIIYPFYCDDEGILPSYVSSE
ncbi:hypothetical protein RI129_003921 [Pyrocoelia pectoralis]|uniref:Olfactomedin-like domain-containing protein n=1 Tax=Pyrocoelia pectoralis TaxID=417401 RepID=A0AAN7VQG6_9COLE